MKKTMNFAFKRPEDSPGFLLWQLTNQWQQQQRKALKSVGLTHPQFVALAGILWLSNQFEKGVSQTQVAQFTHMDKMMMSDLTQTLIKKKLIKSTRDLQDKRSHALTLTSKGHEITLKAIPLVEGVDAKFFQKDSQGLVQLVSLLKERVK